MKTTLELPDHLMREVKIRAAEEGRKLKDLVAELLRLGLDTRSRGARSRKARIELEPELGIPVVVGSPDAPATRMSVEELLETEQKVLEELDLQNGGIPH